MVAVAVFAVALGSYLEGKRLKQKHDEHLTIARRHAAAAEAYRRPLATRIIEARLDDSTPNTCTSDGFEIRETIAQWFDKPGDRTVRTELDERFQQAQSRVVATADIRERIIAANLRKQAEYNQRQAVYHATLARKYAAAASRPWLAVAPDPPKPN
jgi:hypothetical protein